MTEVRTSPRMDPPTASRPPRAVRLVERDRVGRYAVRLGFELLVVFIGVYAAFQVESWQREREDDLRRAQLRGALVREIMTVTGNAREVASEVDAALVAYEAAWANGARPPIQPLLQISRMDAHMWDAALQSGGLDLLDVPLVYRLSTFYNTLEAGFDQIADMRRLSETMILPRLGEGSDVFYDRETGRLDARFEWYPTGLRRLRALARELSATGDSLIAELDDSGS